MTDGLRVPTLARPAQFDRSTQRRRGMIAKIHVAKKQLSIVDDDYRALLVRETGHASAADCSDAELDLVVKALGKIGFTAKPRKAGGRGAADHPGALKARALWISLAQLGVVNRSEKALETFATRQLGCERLQWADQSLVYKLIEALKAMAERNGWSQDVAGLGPNVAVRELKLRLCQALRLKLIDAGVIGADMPLWQVAARVAHVEAARGYIGSMTGWETSDYERLAEAMAGVLARHGAPIEAGQRS